jgi:hypothetical protein
LAENKEICGSGSELNALGTLSKVAIWYFSTVYGQQESKRLIPTHCDSTKVGYFAVDPNLLAEAETSSLFKLLIALSMFQALRDVVIQRQQQAMSPSDVRVVADLTYLHRAISVHPCPVLRSAEVFGQGCDVTKSGKAVDCHRFPGKPCHVKQATVIFNRMGDMGKLPTSALLLFWKEGPKVNPFMNIFAEPVSPLLRAEALIKTLSNVHRVGEKLATMFVSALSTPILYPGLSPWYPQIDGNELVVIDTNVARAVDQLRPLDGSRTYKARANWIRARAHDLDLQSYNTSLPSYSPRLLQQALYAFCSKSNRVEAGDPCATKPGACQNCAPQLCPFIHHTL